MTGNRVALIAEDEPMLAEAFRWALEDAGFDVLLVGTGDAAVPVIERERVDVLVTDVRMPGQLDGWALVARARQLSPDLPVVIVSGYSPDGPGLPSRSRFLQKPFSPEDLVSVVHQVL
jgi:CheY-like chemotaxis protein